MDVVREVVDEIDSINRRHHTRIDVTQDSVCSNARDHESNEWDVVGGERIV